MSDFSDRPFHVGSLVGLRAFKVDSLGRLVGPSQGGVFKPGENEAECKKDRPGSSMTLNYGGYVSATNYYYSQPWTWLSAPTAPEITAAASSLSEEAVEPRESLKPKHVVGGSGCGCGYYAYFDGLNDYMVTGRIAAVVEGYGNYMLGTRGFRSAKARLLGLIAPEFGSYDSGMFSRASSMEIMSPARLAMVLHNYPDVPVYATQDEALDAHPLHEPEVPTPETADDFWTRSAS